jgi:hypothetical protein
VTAHHQSFDFFFHAKWDVQLLSFP